MSMTLTIILTMILAMILTMILTMILIDDDSNNAFVYNFDYKSNHFLDYDSDYM